MKYIISIILLVISLNTFSQKQIPDSCFTKKQIMDISYTIDSLWYLDSINKLIINEQRSIINDYNTYSKLDSTIIAQKNIQIHALTDSNRIYANERNEYYKWYNKKSVWFGIGVTTSAILIKFILGIK
jgi:hypothetical protein